ncbi:tat pathway signal sequence [Fusarium longipes]|uniref:1-alkyl-2-acetylglycerophosphocholine esterase n=1 Tax=Fusarium longipes TaxID=694270 RepID=A0A395T1G1_9HYPO|nr:tat pathway signal sequence [Fusarium longipes]
MELLPVAARWDPYAPHDNPQKRRLLISSFVPLHTENQTCLYGEETIPYMPSKTTQVFGAQAVAMGLPRTIFQDFTMKVCKLPDEKALNSDTYLSPFPVVIFSPGRGVTRLMYSAMAMTLASHGYIVMTVDHAYDAAVIEFPDGSSVTGVIGEGTPAELEKSVEVRQEDIAFILNQLERVTTAEALTSYRKVDRIVVFGHSIGGATAVSSLFADDRVAGAVNLDGDMLGPVVADGVDKPLFLVEKPHSRDQGPSWNQTWGNSHGPGLMMEINGTTHQSFLDLPLLVALEGIPDASKPIVEAAIGTIDGRLMATIMSRLFAAVLEFVLGGGEDQLCQASNRPEIKILEAKGVCL